jgi:hypothetical protein
LDAQILRFATVGCDVIAMKFHLVCHCARAKVSQGKRHLNVEVAILEALVFLGEDRGTKRHEERRNR